MRGLTIAFIHSYESKEQVERCLFSLRKASAGLAANGLEIHWILVKTPRAHAQTLSGFDGRILISNTENIAVNRNLVLESCHTEALYFTDPDCILTERTLDALFHKYKELIDRPEAFAVAGPNLSISNSCALRESLEWLSSVRLLNGGLPQIKISKASGENWHSPTCNILYKIDRLNGNMFSPTFAFVGEDLELHFRLSRFKKRVLICPEALVFHEQSSSFWIFLKKIFRYGCAQTRLLRAHPTSIRNPRLIVLFGFLFWLTVTGILSPPDRHNWILIWCALLLGGFAIEVFLSKRKVRFHTTLAHFIGIAGAYLMGQVWGLLSPLPKTKNAQTRMAKT